MQQYLLFSRKSRIIALLLTIALVTYLLTENYCPFLSGKKRVHCSSELNTIFGDNETLPAFVGIYTFMLDAGQGYISVNGTLNTDKETYTVQRVIKVSSHNLSDDGVFYDIKQTTVKHLTGDNLPEPLYARYIFNPISVVTVNKTLTRSYLIRNLYAPVFICNAVP